LFTKIEFEKAKIELENTKIELENLKRQLAYYEKRHHKVFEYLKELEPLKAFDHEGSIKTPQFSVSASDTDFWDYWEVCINCGYKEHKHNPPKPNTKIVSRAHLIPNSKTFKNLFNYFGKSDNYRDDFKPKSTRNHIPLCGTRGQKYTCHDLFDSGKLVL
jgi:hypothetical protein